MAEGQVMKKLLLILGLVAIGLSGCFVAPYGEHEDGYRRDREHRDEHRDEGRGEDRGDRDRYR